MVVVEGGQARPSKRRKVVEEDISTDGAKDTAKKDLAETSADWIAKELQYDWSKKKKFQVGIKCSMKISSHWFVTRDSDPRPSRQLWECMGIVDSSPKIS